MPLASLISRGDPHQVAGLQKSVGALGRPQADVGACWSISSFAARKMSRSEIKYCPMPHAQVRQDPELFCPSTGSVVSRDLIHAAMGQPNARDAIARPPDTDSVSANCQPWSSRHHRPRMQCAETPGRENSDPENNSDTSS
jgi:hypothetical protein